MRESLVDSGWRVDAGARELVVHLACAVLEAAWLRRDRLAGYRLLPVTRPGAAHRGPTRRATVRACAAGATAGLRRLLGVGGRRAFSSGTWVRTGVHGSGVEARVVRGRRRCLRARRVRFARTFGLHANVARALR